MSNGDWTGDLVGEVMHVIAEIDRLNTEHRMSTGRSAYHLGRCARIDLHRQLVTLHARKQALQTALAQRTKATA
jgi:hypothetical protein